MNYDRRDETRREILREIPDRNRNIYWKLKNEKRNFEREVSGIENVWDRTME